jgi:hypothetical protein
MYVAVYLVWCFYIRPQPPHSLKRIRHRGPLMFQLMESIKAFCIFIGPALACWIGASRIVDCMLALQLRPASPPPPLPHVEQTGGWTVPRFSMAVVHTFHIGRYSAFLLTGEILEAARNLDGRM